MKKTIQLLLLAILVLVLVGLIIFFFNPLNLRNKMIGSMVNYYFQVESLEKSGKTTNFEKEEANEPKIDPDTKEVVSEDKNSLLNEEQEKALESYGVDVEALPQEVTPEMSACFIEKLGEERAMEIVDGATPGPLEIFKAKECLNK